jgi:hypothetical protein
MLGATAVGVWAFPFSVGYTPVASLKNVTEAGEIFDNEL